MTEVTDSQRTAERFVGGAYLLAMPLALFSGLYVPLQLFVTGNAAATARNIIAHERLFRLGVGSDLLAFLVDVVLIAALYTALEPVDRHLALFATLVRLIETSLLVTATVNSLDTLRFLGDADYLKSFAPSSRPARSAVARCRRKESVRDVVEIGPRIGLAERQDPRLERVVFRHLDGSRGVRYRTGRGDAGQIALNPGQHRHSRCRIRAREPADHDGARHRSGARARALGEGGRARQRGARRQRDQEGMQQLHVRPRGWNTANTLLANQSSGWHVPELEVPGEGRESGRFQSRENSCHGSGRAAGPPPGRASRPRCAGLAGEMADEVPAAALASRLRMGVVRHAPRFPSLDNPIDVDACPREAHRADAR
jgi:hypothetical protein